MSRFFVRRKSGYLSPYTIDMFYVAAITRPRQFGHAANATPVIRFGSRFIGVPRPLMEPFRLFNRYRDSNGAKVSTFAKRTPGGKP